MKPYLWCFAFSLLFTYFASRTKYKAEQFLFSLIAILIPSILAGLRAENIGVDVRVYATAHYSNAMQAESLLDYLITERGTLMLESGWHTLTYFSTKIFGSLNMNLFFYSFVTCTCIYIGAWKHRKFVSLPMTMLVFLCMEYCISYCIMRQGVAASIIFMGFDNLEKRHYGRFCVYIAAATLFHSSAVLCVMYTISFYYLLTSKTPSGRDSRTAKFILYSFIFFLFVAREIFSVLVGYVTLFKKYGAYTTMVLHSYSIGLMMLGEFAIFLFYGGGGRRVFANSNPGGTDMFYYYRYGIIFGMVFYMWVQVYPRAYFYFDYINLFAYAAIPQFIREKHLRALVGIILTATYLGYFYYLCKSNIYAIYPYVSIFD